MTNPPAPKLLSLKKSTFVHYKGICKLVLGSHTNHCVTPCLHKHKWIHQYLDLKQVVDSICHQWTHLDPKSTITNYSRRYPKALVVLSL